MDWRARSVHRWMAVVVGGMFVLWLVSGVVMILPPFTSGGSGNHKAKRPNFENVTVAPAEAIGALESMKGKSLNVKNLRLLTILNEAIYQIELDDRSFYLIDGRSGELVEVSKDQAIQIAKLKLPAEVKVLTTEFMSEPNFEYSRGPFPVYKIVFDDNKGTVSYVSVVNGMAKYRDNWRRIQGFITGLHTLNPISLIVESELIRKGLLVLFSVIGIGAAGSGFYLAIRGR